VDFQLKSDSWLTAKLLLDLRNKVILGTESHGTHYHVLFSGNTGDLQTTLWLSSQGYFMIVGLLPINLFWWQAPLRLTISNICDHCPSVTWSLTIIAADSRQRIYSQVWVQRNSWPRFTVLDSRLPNREGQLPVFISPRNRVDELYPQAFGSVFVASYDSKGYGGNI
jgi:hypothetical protein